MMKRRILAIVLAVIMSLFSFSTSGQVLALSKGELEIEQASVEETVKPDQKQSGQKFTAEDFEGTGPVELLPDGENSQNKEKPLHNEKADNKASEIFSKEFDPEEKVTIIVELEKESLLDAGFEASQISDKARASSYTVSQERQIEKMTDKLEKEIKDEVETLYEYKVAITGMAISTEYKNLEKIKNTKGVKSAWVSPVYKVCDVDTTTANATTMIGADVVWNTTGYTGKGMKIAIIDTGLDTKHNSFKALSDDKLTETSMTSSYIDSVWKKLNASKSSIRPFGVYRNTKIPYTYNYVTKSSDVAHPANTSDHGTHVAGIAAANKIESTDVVGVAPDAQLLVMQVFSPTGGADFADVLAAMEDAVYLDVDVMNLSLGSTAGFTDSEEYSNKIFDKFANTDIQVAIASGNDTHNGLQNLHGHNMSLAGNPDLGLVGNPGSYSDAMTVASMDNSAVKALTFSVGDKKIGYDDTAATNYTNWLSKLGMKKDYEYVWVGEGVYGGDVNEFKNANNGAGVEGKIALVSRGGGVAFTDKQANAAAAGAVACIVYNNTSGSMHMQIKDGDGHIPCVAISLFDGQHMISKLENGIGKLTTGNGNMETIINEVPIMSEFSSWGVTPSLNLKPDITGVGGNINSTRNNNTYGLMSGTSMATPQVAGATAIVMQYIHDKLDKGLSEKEIRDLTSALLMSTANPTMSGEAEYSPRLQGAGLINIIDAVSSYGYLTCNEQPDGRPKAELGDSKDGNYSFSFKINNITDKPLYYELDSSLLTEGVAQDGEKYFMTSTPVALDSKVKFNYEGPLCYDFNDDGVINTADVRVLLMALNGDNSLCKRPEGCLDVNGDGTFDKNDIRDLACYIAEMEVSFKAEKTLLVVPASGSVNCSADISISADEKAYMDKYFKNGIFVEGFVYAKSLNGDIESLSMPVMGFYGDWTDAPVFDEGRYNYWQTEGEASLFPIGIFTQQFMLGVNPYVETPYNEEHNAVSITNPLAEFDIGMLRNAKSLTFSVTNADTGEEYWSYTDKYISKSYFNPSYEQIIPYWIANQTEQILWDGTDANGNPVEENTKTILKMTAEVDYEGENKFQSIEMPMWMDNTKPEIVNANELKPKVENGKVTLDLSLKDNRHIAAVIFESLDGTIMAKHTIDGYKPGTTMNYTFDITGFGEEFNIIVADYACNELVNATIVDLGDDFDENTLPLTKLDPEKLYAFESGGDSALQHGWYSANKKDLSQAANITYSAKSRFYSGEYIDGYIYAQNVEGEIVVIAPRNTYWKENVLSQQDSVVLYDMAFDYSENSLYAVGWDKRIGEKGASVLAKVDLKTGEIEIVTQLEGMDSDTMITLACTTEGQLYGVDMSGYLYKIPKTKDTQVETIGLTGFAQQGNFYGVNVIQSMAYDHNTDTVYWNAFSTKYDVNTNRNLMTCGTYTLDLKTAEVKEVGSINNSCGVGLFIPYDGGDILPDTVKPTGVQPVQENMNMIAGQKRKLSLKWDPWNAVVSPVSWTVESQNPDKQGETVAEVDSKGNVTGISAGTAIVTAKTKVYPEGSSEGIEAICKFNVKVLSSTDEMYGFLLADINDLSKNPNTWITFEDINPGNYKVLSETSEIQFTAATYYNGYVYAVAIAQESTDLYKLKVDRNKETGKAVLGAPEKIGSMQKTNITDMAFDYKTGRMYVIENQQAFMYLSLVDLETGALDRISKVDKILVTLACDKDGNLYGLDTEGVLYTFDSETGECTEVYRTNVPAGLFLQSMAYDYNSGNIYWAQCSGPGEASFYLLANTTDENGITEWETIKLGDIGGRKGAEIAGLFTIPEEEPETAYIPVTGIKLDQKDFSMMQDGTYQLSATTEPKRPTIRTKNWSSEDEAIAKVDSLGVVTAVAPGTTTITVSITDRKSGKTYKDSLNVTVIESAGKLQAFLNNDNKDGYYNHWISVPDYNPAGYEKLYNAIDIYRLVAGDYYDGDVYAYNENGVLYRINTEDYSYKEIGSYKEDGVNIKIKDMTYDYTNFRMLALGSTDWGSKTAIYSVDLNNGALTKIIDLKDENIYGFAYGNGKYYGVKQDGMICTVDLAKGTLTNVVATNNKIYSYETDYNTTLTFDHNNNRLYMAPIVVKQNSDGWSSYEPGELHMIDVEGKVSMPIGNIGQNGAYVCCMYMTPEKGNVPENKNVKNVELSQDMLRVATGSSRTIEAIIMPSTATNKNVTWKSSDDSIAIVENGKVTGVKPGTATITATTEEGNLTSSCQVTVMDQKDTSGSLAYGFSKEHGGLITFNPELPNLTIKKLSSYDEVGNVLGSAIVDGAMYFLKNVENYYPKLYKMDLNVHKITEIGIVPIIVGPANDMTYDPFTKLLYVASGFYIYVVDPATGDVVTCVNVNNNTNYALTAANGSIYWVGSDGYNNRSLYEINTDTIFKAANGDTLSPAEHFKIIGKLNPSIPVLQESTMEYDYTSDKTFLTAGGFIYEVDLKTGNVTKLDNIPNLGGMTFKGVSDPSIRVTNVELNKETVKMKPEMTYQLTAKVSPDNKYVNKNVSWESDNKAVATVDAKGVVTAVSPGTAKITVTTESGALKDTCTVTVVAPGNEKYVYAYSVEEKAFVKFDSVVPEIKAEVVLKYDAGVDANGSQIYPTGMSYVDGYVYFIQRSAQDTTNLYRWNVENNKIEMFIENFKDESGWNLSFMDMSVCGNTLYLGGFDGLYTVDVTTKEVTKAIKGEYKICTGLATINENLVIGQMYDGTMVTYTRKDGVWSYGMSKNKNEATIEDGIFAGAVKLGDTVYYATDSAGLYTIDYTSNVATKVGNIASGKITGLFTVPDEVFNKK